MAEQHPSEVDAGSERVAELFDRLADLDPAEAEQRLLVECAGDLALEREVRALLAHDRQAAGGFLAPVAAEVLGRASDRPPRDAPELQPSSRLGRYHVLDKVGEGGMGSVYIGHDEALDRRVALKVVRGAARREWLRREGQALARFAHANVVSIYEVGEQDGIVFLAMELVEGPTLREWLDSAPRSFTDILRLFRQAGHGLVAVHRAGLVHRDFKPDNVLVGADGRAKVADFGIAALASRGAAETPNVISAVDLPANLLDQPLTERGLVVGTPAFMAPEQLAGGRATPASDQWSFAVAFYRTVYGVAPYSPEALRTGTAGPALPPHRADVPAWLWPILATALNRESSRRFPSMDHLLRAIDEHLPPDPDLDPTVVVDERRRLTVVFAVGYLVHSIMLLVPSSTEVMLRPVSIVAWPLSALVAIVFILSTRRRQLAQNRYGRRLSLLFLGFPAALLMNGLLCLRLGLTGRSVLTMESFTAAIGFAALAQDDEHRWLSWLAAVSLAQAAASAAAPEHATLVIGAGGAITFAAICARVFVDRHIDAKAALGAIGRDDERRR